MASASDRAPDFAIAPAPAPDSWLLLACCGFCGHPWLVWPLACVFLLHKLLVCAKLISACRIPHVI